MCAAGAINFGVDARKKEILEKDRTPPTHLENPKALLNVMNTNIKTMRRIRHTHAKFAALNATTLANEETEEGAAGAAAAGTSGGFAATAGSSGVRVPGADGGALGNASADDEILNEKVDERPWTMMAQGKGKGKETIARVGGIEVGDQNAWGCLQWTNQKILEHVGFQGTSQIALDVLAGVMSEYLSNVGRTIKYLCDIGARPQHDPPNTSPAPSETAPAASANDPPDTHQANLVGGVAVGASIAGSIVLALLAWWINSRIKRKKQDIELASPAEEKPPHDLEQGTVTVSLPQIQIQMQEQDEGNAEHMHHYVAATVPTYSPSSSKTGTLPPASIRTSSVPPTE